MDELTDALTHKIPLGLWIRDATDFVTNNFAEAFDLVSLVLGTAIEGLIELLLWPHPLAFIAVLAAAAYAIHRSWRLVALTVLGVILILNLGYWEATIETIGLVVCATVLCLLVGVPLGTALALTRFPGRGLALALVNTGMGLPPVVVGLVITILLWRSGPLGPLGLLFTPQAMILAQFIVAAPIIAGFTRAALGLLDQELTAALRVDGAAE